MGLEDVVRALRSRIQVILLLTLVGLAAAAGLAALKTPTYEATSQINLVGPNVNGDATGQAAALGKVPTFIELLPSQGFLQATIDKLKLTTSWQDLEDRVEVSNPPTTSLLEITVSDSSAARAAAIANALGADFDGYLEEAGQAAIRSFVVSAADVPDSAASPKLLRWLLVGGLLGLACGVIYALVRASLDRTVRSAAELTDLVGLPVRGVVPFAPGANRQPLPVSDPGTGPRAEALRQLRTNLQFLHLEQDAAPPRSILITSAAPGEGKTSTACNVAIALAQAGLSTILIGADLRRPDLAGHMGVSAQDGLASVLAGWVTLDDALRPWGQREDQLWVLPSGETPSNPSELLASEQMQQLLAELQGRADMVIIDGAPLLPVADSAALAAICDGTLLVVAAHRTTHDDLSRAVSTLAGVDAVVLGAVLNMAAGLDRKHEAYLNRAGAGRKGLRR